MPGTTAEELVYDLVFDWEKKVFEDFDKSFKSIVSGFAKLTAGLLAAQAVGFALAKSTAKTNDELAKQSKRLNIASEDLQKLKFNAELGGASMDDLTGSLKNLSKAQEDVLRGKGDLEAFGQLGINPADFENSNDLLLAISDSISQIESDSEKINLLERIGVSGNLLQTLENGSDEIRKIGKEFEDLGGIVSEEQKKLAQDFNDNITKILAAFGGIKNGIGSALIDPFNEFIEIFLKFVKSNMKQIVSGFKDFFEIVSRVSNVVFGILGRVFNVLISIVDLFGGFENAVKIVSAAFLILQRRMILTFAVPLAIGTALFLIIEDIVKALEGQDSVTKDILESTGLLGEVFRGIAFVIQKAAEGWTLFFTKGETALLGLKVLINDLIDIINKIPFIDIGKFDIGMPAVPKIVRQSAGTEIAQAGGQQQAVAGSTMNNIKININGATDPKAVVDAINREMQRKSNALFGNT